MEQQEELKKNIPRRTTTQSKSTSPLPLDLISEILLRLPAKSVVRSRCVSKLWSAITTDPYFTNSFKTRQATRLSVLLFFKKGNTLFVFSIPEDHQNSNESDNTSFMPIGRYQMKSSKHSYFSPTESVHGLICFQDSGKPVLWNPSMREFLTLSKHKETREDITCFLGYDPIEGKHKVMCMPPNKICDECSVLTLGSAQQSWRMIKTKHKHLSSKSCYGRCINGVVYYKARLDDHSNVDIVMSFDVRSEKFSVIKLPTINRVYTAYGMLIPYEGRLACVAINCRDNGTTLWILEDAEKHEWSCKHFPAPLNPYRPSLETHFHLDSITPAGVFIYLPRQSLKPFYILYFDPKRNSFREIEFVDEELRLSNGLGNIIQAELHSCAHHIESLMSL